MSGIFNYSAVKVHRSKNLSVLHIIHPYPLDGLPFDTRYYNTYIMLISKTKWSSNVRSCPLRFSNQSSRNFQCWTIATKSAKSCYVLRCVHIFIDTKSQLREINTLYFDFFTIQWPKYVHWDYLNNDWYFTHGVQLIEPCLIIVFWMN